MKTRASLGTDERGVVYIEFIIAFMPIFLLFLGTCQVALMTAAEVLVGQAANQGARAAIVVLEEDPIRYNDAERGDLAGETPSEENSLSALTEALGLSGAEIEAPSPGEQQGARMGPIRQAAYVPLLALAPFPAAYDVDAASLGKSVRAGWLESLDFAFFYTRAATAVSIVTGPGSDELVMTPVGPTSDVTVRVTYAFHCSVPLIRTLVCSDAETITALDRQLNEEEATSHVGVLKQAELADAIASSPAGTRFLILKSEVTLPNQGAPYY